MKKYDVIVDTLSLDSIFSLAKNGLLFNKNIGFCRVTRLGKILINIKYLIGSTFEQIHQPLNSCQHGLKTLAVKREELLSILMKQEIPDAVYDLSETLKVSKDKVVESYRVHLWNAYYHQSEAIVRSANEACAVVLNMPSVFKNNIVENNCTYYNNRIDRTKIICRDGYMYDDQYDINRVSYIVLMGFLSYVLSLLSTPISLIFYRTNPLPKDIAVQVLRKNIDRSKKSDLFWMDDDKLIDHTLLVSNNKYKCFSNACNISNINISKKSINQFSWLLNYRFIGEYLSTFGSFLKMSKLLFKYDYLNIFFPNLLNFFIYRSIFKLYQTKVFISNHSYFNAAPLFAADSLKVVYVRGTWSNQGYPHQHIATSSDVFFAWGDVTIDNYTRSGKSNTSYVKTGFIDGKNMVFKVQKRNTNNKVRIGFFDNLTSNDLVNSNKDLRGIFLSLVKLMETYGNMTVVYKPKSGDMMEIYKSKMENVLEKYIRASRFIILKGERAYSNPASKISNEFDLVIGYPISTAATESMITGVPCIHYNPFKIYQHYWERRQKTIPIVRSISELEKEIELFLNTGSTSVDDWTDLRKSVNYFDDNMATERMQFYIELLCDCDQRHVMEKVKYANLKYVEKYGVNAIVS